MKGSQGLNSKTKVMTLMGTRPEIIRLSALIKSLDKVFDHTVVHTGQNFDKNLKDVFFEDLDLRQPDFYLDSARPSLGESLATLFSEFEKVLDKIQPRALVILGDTNSALAGVLAKRRGIIVYHLEAGNRSFDINVPEETNRKIVDHFADFNLAYTRRAYENLMREGLHPRMTMISGSPIPEAIESLKNKVAKSKILADNSLSSKQYIVASFHREENVDTPQRLTSIVEALINLSSIHNKRVIVSTHPRTQKLIDSLAMTTGNLEFFEPFGYVDYLRLQTESFVTVSDSGTISEEASALDFPAVTIRDSMERPEALDAGSIVMCGIESSNVQKAVQLVTAPGAQTANKPEGYEYSLFSEKVTRFIFSTVTQAAFWQGRRKNSEDSSVESNG